MQCELIERKYRLLLTNHIEFYARLTDVELYQNILEPFCTKMHSDAMRLTDQLGYSMCLFYGQGIHLYSTYQIGSKKGFLSNHLIKSLMRTKLDQKIPFFKIKIMHGLGSEALKS